MMIILLHSLHIIIVFVFFSFFYHYYRLLTLSEQHGSNFLLIDIIRPCNILIVLGSLGHGLGFRYSTKYARQQLDMRVHAVAFALAVVTTLYSCANGDSSKWPRHSYRYEKNSRRRPARRHHHHHFRGRFDALGMDKSQPRPQTSLSKVHLPHNLKEENKNIHTEKFSQKSVDKESSNQTQINSRAKSVENKWGDAVALKDDNQMKPIATDEGGYGSVDNAWDKKLNAALNEEDHMVNALHKKTDNMLAGEVKSSLPKSFMNELLSPSILNS